MVWRVPETQEEYKQHIAGQIRRQGDGYLVVLPEEQDKDYDLAEITPLGERVAIQVKLYTKKKVGIDQVKKLLEFLETPAAAEFAGCARFVSVHGYSEQVFAFLEQIPNNKIALYVCNEKTDGRLEPAIPIRKPLHKWFGVFTSKGGVGKTTVAAHLAGAFARMGYKVLLLDVDPEQNLHRLFFNPELGKAELEVSFGKNSGENGKITVLDYNKFIRQSTKEPKAFMFDFIVVDCSPVLEENPKELLRVLDCAIIPTILNPLGLAKNSGVITRTFNKLRSVNNHANLFCLVNAYAVAEKKRNDVLVKFVQQHVGEYVQKTGDQKCALIPPEEVCIRHSTALLYWGYHIIDQSKPELAFRPAGRCYPLEDFLKLSEYLIEHLEL